MTAKKGHNQPPETEFDTVNVKINDLYGEARLWLDGEKVDNERSAEGITTLLNMLRSAKKDAEKAFKDEKAPHAALAKAVDDKYRPLKDKAQRAADACKSALTPWLEAKEKEKDAEVERLRQEAEEKTLTAQKAFASTPLDHLVEREKTELLAEEAKEAEKDARRAAGKSSNTKGKVGKAVGLRTSHNTTLTDPILAIRHFWPNDEINELLMKLARQEVRQGVREIPGFEIITKRAV